MKKLIYLILNLLLAISVLLVLLVSTNMGAYFTLYIITAFSPVPLHFQGVEGNLLNQLTIKNAEINLPDQGPILLPTLEIKLHYQHPQFAMQINIPLLSQANVEKNNSPPRPNTIKNLKLRLAGTLQDYYIKADLELILPDLPVSHWSLQANGNETELNLKSLVVNVLTSKIEMQGKLPPLLAFNEEKNDKLALTWNMSPTNLSVLSDTFNGTLHADGKIQGTMHEPIFSGKFAGNNFLINKLRIKKATGSWKINFGEHYKMVGDINISDSEIYSAPLNINFTEMQIKLKQTQPSALFYNAAMHSQQGTLFVEGTTNLNATPPTAEFHVTGENFLIYNYPNAKIYASPDLYLNIKYPSLSLTGDLFIPKVNLTAIEFNNYISPSADVVISRSSAPPEIPSAWQFTANINLQLGEDVHFSAYGLDTGVKGQLTLNQDQGILLADGKLELVNGKYSIYGQTLDIPQGQLIYKKSAIANPLLDIDAQRKIRVVKAGSSMMQDVIDTSHLRQSMIDGIVGVHVQGSLNEPKTTLFSNPNLSPTEQLSYLLTGLPTAQLSSAQGQLLAQAALSLFNKNSSEEATQKIATAFGLDEVSIKSSTDLEEGTGNALSHTSLILGKALSPKLFVSYSVGLLDPINILRLQYKLTQHWLLQSSTSTDGNSAGDILFYWDKD